MPYRRTIWRALVVAAIVALPLAASAQRGGWDRYFGFGGGPSVGALPYDGRFVFTRIRYNYNNNGSRFGGGSNAWNHDYPAADRNIALILDALTSVHARRRKLCVRLGNTP